MLKCIDFANAEKSPAMDMIEASFSCTAAMLDNGAMDDQSFCSSDTMNKTKVFDKEYSENSYCIETV